MTFIALHMTVSTNHKCCNSRKAHVIVPPIVPPNDKVSAIQSYIRLPIHIPTQRIAIIHQYDLDIPNNATEIAMPTVPIITTGLRPV